MKNVNTAAKISGYSGLVSTGYVMLRWSLTVVLAAYAGLSSPLPAAANPSSKTKSYVTPASSFMRIFGLSQAPYGFVRFCEASPEHCVANSQEDARVDATPDRLAQLDDVNRSVNRQIKPMTDLEIYGVTEFWTIPRTVGDCEDYALLKRKLLMQRGWPSSALLMTVVRDEKGEGHAVLTARTAQGDFVLDNKSDAVKIWHQTPYDFVMRQSYLNPKVWVALEAGDAVRPAALAGVNARR
ncbi:MAG: transglutaminase-like cysteine peptidase [Hyphomicrobiaceae bacterium]